MVERFNTSERPQTREEVIQESALMVSGLENEIKKFGVLQKNPEKNVFNENLKNDVLKKYPKLKLIEHNLQIDGYSKFENIKWHLEDLSSLPNTTLSKISKSGKYIYITDRPPTTAWVGFSPKGLPQGYPKGWTWENCGGVHKDGNVYVGRGKNINGEYLTVEEYANKHAIFHELGHAFDFMSDCLFSKDIKKYFDQFFKDKIRDSDKSYLGQYDGGYKEFFAECVLYFFRRGEDTFKEYFSEDFCNYMKKCLL